MIYTLFSYFCKLDHVIFKFNYGLRILQFFFNDKDIEGLDNGNKMCVRRPFCACCSWSNFVMDLLLIFPFLYNIYAFVNVSQYLDQKNLK